MRVQFGEIDIDSELVTARDTLGDGEQQIMMLNNGCLCCTVRDDLVKMLAELVSRANTAKSCHYACDHRQGIHLRLATRCKTIKC